jgi:hypothetical protein
LPDDVSRSGYIHHNLYLLVQACGFETDFLELALIHCDKLGAAMVERFHLGGRLDSLKRVEIFSGDGTTLFRCARLAYRAPASPAEAGFSTCRFTHFSG